MDVLVAFSAHLILAYREVGYSMPGARPPVEVYPFNPLSKCIGYVEVGAVNAGVKVVLTL